MPTNLYGSNDNDNYELANSHVLPALLRKNKDAELPGDAEHVVSRSDPPMREFLYVDDLADAYMHLIEQSSEVPFVNNCTSTDVTFHEQVKTVMGIVSF